MKTISFTDYMDVSESIDKVNKRILRIFWNIENRHERIGEIISQLEKFYKKEGRLHELDAARKSANK